MSPIQAFLKTAEARLSATSGTARLDAEILTAHVLGLTRMRLFTESRALTAEEMLAIGALLARRAAGEPIAYITGTQEFWSLEFAVSADTLIPRPDTETLVEVALKRAPSANHILDLGTGTGCILLSLLHELGGANGLGVDLNPGAVALASGNADRLGLGARASFQTSDWFSAVKSVFDLIVSNPPYIPSADLSGLMVDVRDYEPMTALDGGPDGLAPYRLIAETAPNYLEAGGVLAVEVGIHQARDVAALFEAGGFTEVEITPDLGGIDRVVSAKNRNKG